MGSVDNTVAAAAGITNRSEDWNLLIGKGLSALRFWEEVQ